MKKNFVLTLLLLLCVFTFTGCKNGCGKSNINKIKLSEAVENTQDLENFTMKVQASIEYSQVREDYNGELIVMDASADVELSMAVTKKNVAISLKLDYKSDDESQDMKFDVFMTDIDTEHPGAVITIPGELMGGEDLTISFTYEELLEAIELGSGNLAPSEPGEMPELPDIDMNLLQEVVEFLGEVKDEYFTVEGDYYVFNQKGKDEVKKLADKIIDEINRLAPDAGVNDFMEQFKQYFEYSYEIKAQTDDKYVKEVIVKVDMTTKEGTDAPKTSIKCELKVSLSNIDKTNVSVPKADMSFTDFVESMNGNGGADIE